MVEAKWFTGARKFPQLIGRTPDGGKLPGGPYTITQVVVAVVGAVVLGNTVGFWARFSFVGNLVVGPGVLIALVWAIGKIPFDKRNPAVVGAGWLRAAGRLISVPAVVRFARPRLVHGSVLMISAPSTAPVESVDPATPSAPSTDPSPTSRSAAAEPVLTGVQQLLLDSRR